MQVVLCAALGVSVALAWWIGHVHAAVLNPSLGDAKTFANRVFDVEVRLPVDWKIEGYSPDDVPARLDVVEDKPAFGSIRAISIIAERLQPSSPLPTPGQLVGYVMGNRPFTREISFELLGQPAVLREYPQISGRETGKTFRAALYACAVIPGQKHAAMIGVSMKGPLTFAPADIELLKNIALIASSSKSRASGPQNYRMAVFKPGRFRPAAPGRRPNTR